MNNSEIRKLQREYDLLDSKARKIETEGNKNTKTLWWNPVPEAIPYHKKMEFISKTLEKETSKVVAAHGRLWVIFYVPAFHGWVFTKYPRKSGMLSDPQETFEKAFTRLKAIKGWGRTEGSKGLK